MFAAMVLMFCRTVVALTFALSAAGKAFDVSTFQEAVTDFRLLPPSWSKAVAWTLLASELTVVVTMAIGGSALLPGFVLSAVLLVIFSAALIVALSRNARTSCNCFGWTERRISPYDVGRNAVLIACSLAGIRALVGPLQVLSEPELLFIVLMAACFVALVINSRAVIETLRQPFRTS